MTFNQDIDQFLCQYDKQVDNHAQKLRVLLKSLLPGIIEQVDLPAKMVAYSYGTKYADMICVLIPSKKGLKLGFSWGVDLKDPGGWLQGSGKISRYVEINSDHQINSPVMQGLILNALEFYQHRSPG